MCSKFLLACTSWDFRNFLMMKLDSVQKISHSSNQVSRPFTIISSRIRSSLICDVSRTSLCPVSWPVYSTCRELSVRNEASSATTFGTSTELKLRWVTVESVLLVVLGQLSAVAVGEPVRVREILLPRLKSDVDNPSDTMCELHKRREMLTSTHGWRSTKVRRMRRSGI